MPLDGLTLGFMARELNSALAGARIERVNQPADPNHHWRFRFHLPLSVLNSEKASELRVQIEGLIKDSNRYC